MQQESLQRKLTGKVDSNSNEIMSDYEPTGTPQDTEEGSAVETSSTCSMEETCAKIEDALKRNLKMRDGEQHSSCRSPPLTDVNNIGW